MSPHQNRATSLVEPRRNLRLDFTAHTVRRAAVAKRRANRKQQYVMFFKEPFSMKSLKILRTAPVMGLAVALVIAGSASAYAFSNWFNGAARVSQDSSVFSVDLSTCKGNLPAGVSNSDRSKVQFKILGSSHIFAADLEAKLLAECEFNAVLDFYHSNPATANYYLSAATAKAVSGNAVTVEYVWGGQAQQKTLALALGATVYQEGRLVTLADIHPGDHIVLAVEAQPLQEGVNPFDSILTMHSIFKTKYDTTIGPGTSKKGFYEDNNIMPLDWYNQINK